MQQSRSRELLITLFLLLGVVLLFAFTKLDIFIQEFFYNANTHQWLLDRDEGFALLSLFFLFKSQRNQKRAVIIALLIGFSIGIYKMLIGDHFFSHTIIAMLIAWLIILLIDSLITIQQRIYIAKSAKV
ncbi:MAG: phosphatase PAP2 family protein [Sulfurimonas sp.]|jgi:membrane-associated PAP2 superfamily phosphatase